MLIPGTVSSEDAHLRLPICRGPGTAVCEREGHGWTLSSPDIIGFTTLGYSG